MQLQIKHPNMNEMFLLDIIISEIEGQTIYKSTFLDKRLYELYGIITIKRKPDNFWKFPETTDSFLLSLVSEIIFQIMNNEITS